MWIFLVFIKINIFLVGAELETIQNEDPTDWRKDVNLAKFNEIYAVTVNEEYLNYNGFCDGKCNYLIFSGRLHEDKSLKDKNICLGLVQYCWFKEETEARRKFMDKFTPGVADWASFNNKGFFSYLTQWNLNHTGNICGCLCHRLPDPFNMQDSIEHGRDKKLLDSFCFDPVTVEKDNAVVTGVKFSRRNNIIYLDIQHGKFVNGRVIENTVRWSSSQKCNDARKVIFNFKRINKSYDGMKIVLEDIILPKNAVVTGVKFNHSLSGKYYSKHHDFISTQKVNQTTQCSGSTTSLTNHNMNLWPSTGSIGKNTKLSESCKNDIIFTGTSLDGDFIQHIVPFVDLQQVVTDPPQPIRGIGWYHRRPDIGEIRYGGILALRIFTDTFEE